MSGGAPCGGAGLDGFDGRQWVEGHAASLSIARAGAWNGEGYRWILNPCPWDLGHTNDAAYIVQMPSGAMAAGCHHNGCAGKGWHDLRDLVEPEWRRLQDDSHHETAENGPSAAALHDEVLDEPGVSEGLVDGAEVLGGLEQFLKRHVVFANEHQSVAVTLWDTHTHMIEAAAVTPYLGLTSPQKRCGKTLLLELLALTCARPWATIRPSEAVLFRKIHQHNPTMLLDEVDTIFRDKSDTYEGIRAVLNAGYRRGVMVSRCVVEEGQVRLAEFRVFCPKALSGIGVLPDTVADRSIPIRFVRKARHEHVERFRIKRAKRAAAPVVRALRAWAAQNVKALGEAIEEDRVEIPAELNDRAADGWEVLLAIADLAGGEWPKRARAAATAIHADSDTVSETVDVALLRGIRAVFQETGADKMFTVDLARALMRLDEEPWAEEWGKIQENPKALGHRLRKLLKPYGISSAEIRTDERTGKGYQLKQFGDAFSRYLTSFDAPSFSATEEVDAAGVSQTPPFLGRFQNATSQQFKQDKGLRPIPYQNRLQHKIGASPCRTRVVSMFRCVLAAKRRRAKLDTTYRPRLLRGTGKSVNLPMPTLLIPPTLSSGAAPMTPTELLGALRQSGCALGVRDGRLMVRGSRRHLEGLQTEIRQHEGDLLVLLRAEAAASPPLVADGPVAPGDDGCRVWLRATGELMGWPRLPIGSGAAIATGHEAWMTFIACARNGEWVGRAVAVLGEVGGLPRDEIGRTAEVWWQRQEGRVRDSMALAPEKENP